MLVQASPLYVPSVRVDSTPPWINYVVSYPRCSIAPKKEPVQSSFPSQELVSTINQLVYPIGAWEPFLPSLGQGDLEFPFDSDLIVCRSSNPSACDSSLIDSTNPDQNLHRHMEYG